MSLGRHQIACNAGLRFKQLHILNEMMLGDPHSCHFVEVVFLTSAAPDENVTDACSELKTMGDNAINTEALKQHMSHKRKHHVVGRTTSLSWQAVQINVG